MDIVAGVIIWLLVDVLGIQKLQNQRDQIQLITKGLAWFLLGYLTITLYAIVFGI